MLFWMNASLHGHNILNGKAYVCNYLIQNNSVKVNKLTESGYYKLDQGR